MRARLLRTVHAHDPHRPRCSRFSSPPPQWRARPPPPCSAATSTTRNPRVSWARARSSSPTAASPRCCASARRRPGPRSSISPGTPACPAGSTCTCTCRRSRIRTATRSASGSTTPISRTARSATPRRRCWRVSRPCATSAGVSRSHLRDAIDQGYVKGPRIYAAGKSIAHHRRPRRPEQRAQFRDRRRRSARRARPRA